MIPKWYPLTIRYLSLPYDSLFPAARGMIEQGALQQQFGVDKLKKAVSVYKLVFFSDYGDPFVFEHLAFLKSAT